MPFKNRVRLPFHLNKPQYPETRTVYRRADGKTIVQSVVVRKEYQGSTDWWPETIHERFKIALAHDVTTVEADVYIGDISQDGDYTINWQESNYPAAPASFKAEVTPFNATNSNCQTCEEAIQLSLEDNDLSEGLYGTRVPLDEGSVTNYNIVNNDNICCYPVVFSMIYYDVDVVAGFNIDQATGVLSITLKSPLHSANRVKLATYRATCSNGGYDEADIYADISGSVEDPCLAPTAFFTYLLGTDNAPLQWNAPSPAPSNGYHVEVYEASNPGSPVFTADTTNTNVVATGLNPGTDYKTYVHSICDDGHVSNDAEVDFTTGGIMSGSCGKYSVIWSDPEFPTSISSVSFYNCDGSNGFYPLVNGSPRIICALESSPGNPVMMNIDNDGTFGHPGSSEYNYIGTC